MSSPRSLPKVAAQLGREVDFAERKTEGERENFARTELSITKSLPCAREGIVLPPLTQGRLDPLRQVATQLLDARSLQLFPRHDQPFSFAGANISSARGGFHPSYITDFTDPCVDFIPRSQERGLARLGAERRGMTVCSTPLRGMDHWGFALCNICTKAVGKCWQK